MDLNRFTTYPGHNLHEGMCLVKLLSVGIGFVNFSALTLSRAAPEPCERD